MFRCKQCGRQFGANVPRRCPDCGRVSNREEQGLRRLFVFGTIEVLTQAVVLAVLIGLILAGLGGWFGWF
ncbi:MAG: hypothetical protein AAGA29_05465 [Planctomycetota bacterium]